MTASLILPIVRPCATCGTSDRYNGGKCKFCANIRTAKYYAANKDKFAVRNAAYQVKNADAIKKQKSDAYYGNHEQIRAAQKVYKDNNREKINAAAAAKVALDPEKKKAAMKEWRKANADQIRIKKAAYKLQNPDKEKIAMAAYRAANKDKRNATTAQWAKDNKRAKLVINHNYRASKKAAGGKLSRGLAEKLFVLQKGKCPCCQRPLGDDFHMDHVVALHNGGENIDANIQLLRAVCNSSKSTKDPIDFMQSRGFLL